MSNSVVLPGHSNTMQIVLSQPCTGSSSTSLSAKTMLLTYCYSEFSAQKCWRVKWTRVLLLGAWRGEQESRRRWCKFILFLVIRRRFEKSPLRILSFNISRRKPWSQHWFWLEENRSVRSDKALALLALFFTRYQVAVYLYYVLNKPLRVRYQVHVWTLKNLKKIDPASSEN